MKKFPINSYTVVLTIAPSGAGKTFFCQKEMDRLKQQYPEYRFGYVSSDDNRRYVLGNPNIHKHDPRMMPVSKQAFDLLYQQLDSLISYPANNHVVFVDATHLSPTSRKRVINIAEKHDYDVVGLVFKYKKRDNYFEFLDDNDLKWVVRNHVEKFYKNTLRELGDLKTFNITSHYFDNYGFEIKDYENQLNHYTSSNAVIVGDIHGEYEKLNEIYKIFPDRNIILLGDIVDKNSVDNIHKTIDLVYDQMINGYTKMICGNHDFAVYSWIVQNGRYTIDIIEKHFDSALSLSENAQQKLKYIVENSYNFLVSDKFVATHSPCNEKYLAKFKCGKQQRNWRYPKKGDGESRESWSERVLEAIREQHSDESFYPFHVFGHVALNGFFRGKSYIGLDTGACYGNQLSYIDFSEKNPKILGIGEKKDHEELVKFNAGDINQKEIDLDDLDARERGRILWMARNGLPVTSGTMCPADKQNGVLESLDWALDYFENPILQIKSMGSWSVIRLKPRVDECKVFSRNGFLINRDGKLNDALQQLIDQIDWNKYRELVVGAELMPWRFLGETLIDKEFYGLGYLVDRQIKAMRKFGFGDALRRLEEQKFDRSKNKKDFVEEYGHHVWSTMRVFDMLEKENFHNLDRLEKENGEFKKQVDLFGCDGEPQFIPFVIYKIKNNDGSEEIWANDNTVIYDFFKNCGDYHIVDKTKNDWREQAHTFFDDITELRQHEGVVAKPMSSESGKAPYLKIRNPEYLRIAYGFDYKLNEQYHADNKSIKRKMKQSIRDWERGVEILGFPLDKIDDKNNNVVQLFADFVVDKKKLGDIDPRL